MENTFKKLSDSNSLPSNIVLATPGDRLVACLIDGILIAVLFAILPAIGAFIGITYVLMRDALPFLNGRSIGKKMMNIRVVKEENYLRINGDYSTSILRSITLCIPLFNVIDGFLVLSTDRKRIGDKLAKTIVIKDINF